MLRNFHEDDVNQAQAQIELICSSTQHYPAPEVGTGLMWQ